MSQILAVASQAPDMKTLGSPGLRETLMTSPLWSLNCDLREDVSMSHSMQLISPDDVISDLSSKKRQEER